MAERFKVLIRRCEQYDPQRIGGIIREGMEELDVRPAGRILLKPNVVIAHPEVFPHAFTRKEFLEGALIATRSRAENFREIAVGERSGITLPTRFTFKNAGYPEVLKRQKAKTYYFDETKQVPVALEGKDSLRAKIFVPEPVARADFFINLPKFKAHPWCRLTLSLKNLIGLQDDRHRLVDHNLFLEHKIADLQEVIQTKFIAVDAIIAGQRMMLTPTPFPMGAIVMGTNACAVDTVCCHMVHVNPQDLIHLRYASGRGFGPMDLEEIEVSGDWALPEIREKTRHFEFCLEPIDRYFGKSSNLRCTVGTFPEIHSPDDCWGGCPGALQEAMHILKAYYPNVLREMKKVRYVVGKIDRPLLPEEDEKVLFVGNCTSWEGRMGGQPVRIDRSYKPPQEVDEGKTKSNDMLLKTWKTLWSCFRQRNSRYIRARGCPVSVGDHIHYLSAIGKIKNVNFDPRMVFPLNVAYWKMRFHRALNRLWG